MEPSSPTYDLPNYGVHRIEAALKSHPALADAEVRVIETRERDPDAMWATLAEFDADLVGLSTYLWSLTTVFDVARRYKADKPSGTVVAGGPSAREAMFRVAPFDRAHEFIDGLVIDEPELGFCEIAAAPRRDAAGLGDVPGLMLPHARRTLVGSHWSATPKRVNAPRLQDRIVSPYQLGMMDRGGMACLQTYYGCPFSCTFCSWGAMGDASDVVDVEYLERELAAMLQSSVEGVLLVDAALNLNAQAFRNFEEAERRVGLLDHALLHAEVYPAKLSDRHLRFIERIRRPSLAVGVQSFDTEVLQRLDRTFDAVRFERVVGELSTMADLVVELIVGLPGDGPDSFIQTFERALALGCSVRVYPCLVLPDGFMTRAPEHFAITWDPVSLKVLECWGWTRDDLARVGAYLERRVLEHGGTVGEYWYSFDSFTPGTGRAHARDGTPVSAALAERLATWVPKATFGAWTLQRAYSADGRLYMDVKTRSGALTLWAEPDRTGQVAFARASGLAFCALGEVPEAERGVFETLVPVLARVLGGSSRAAHATPGAG
jgi:radical SAM superfamily enzyme YgiQ (UPF0313 family)